MDRRVVLPAPFGPRSPKTSPGLTEKVKAFTATKDPNVLVKPLTSITCFSGCAKLTHPFYLADSEGALKSLPGTIKEATHTTKRGYTHRKNTKNNSQITIANHNRTTTNQQIHPSSIEVTQQLLIAKPDFAFGVFQGE
jgi:hypothetical protein